MDSRSDLLDLAQHLKQERLFVSSECQHVQSLNEKVQGTLERLFRVAWIAKQQRHNLESLILSRPGTSTAICCQKANALENLTFVDGYKQLSISESSYAECLQAFRENPKLIAMCLASGEKLNIELMHRMVQVVMGSIYGHCILQEDEAHVLHLLKHLMELQLATSDNPRRLLQHGSCAFSRVYKLFNEGLFLAKVFLTGALHEPIMHLLMEDELFLDIDPGKAVIRFPLAERLKRFGKEGTPQYAANLQKYRLWTISKLVNLTNRFISGIRSNLYCFPHSLLWLVKQLYNVVMKACKVEVREVGAMCADLVFAFFICPAIVNPEPYGICDAPISYIARFNLMQVAQILQVLAMSKWEEIDPKLMDLYGRFDRNVMSSVLDLMLEGSVDENPMEGGNPQLQGLVRTAILITHSDLMGLIDFLRLVSAEASDEWLDKKALESLQSGFPIVTTPSIMTHTGIPEMLPISIQTPPHTPVSKRTSFTKVNRRSNKFPAMTPPVHEHYNDIHRCDLESQSISRPFVEDVLVISLNVATECPGMLPEHKILAMENQNKQARVRLNLDTVPGEDESIVSGGEMQEKRTRFSLSQDQDSIGNTSDNLEAVSEAASNHSVTSSLELENENENDNLSDMVSANVSGRGTPNVSGRDTPSSQVDPDERDQQQLDLPITARKQNREDINEKFGKFEIKGMIGGDETVSLVSDTWSTDVLASDSENVEQVDANQNEWPLDEISFASATSVEAGQHANLLDIAETCSEAWSTDVLASDSERLQELDTDDVSSIGRSDDTASVARSDDTGRSETDADTGIETLRVDVVEHGDENITPRASGSRSPIDGPVPDLACKDHWLHGLHVAADVHELSETFSLMSSDQNQTDGDTPVAHRKHVLDLMTGYDQLERQKSDFSPTSHDSEGFKGNQNMISTRRSMLDSHSGNGYEASAQNVSESEDNGQVPSDVTPEIMGMQTLGRLSLSINEFTDNGFLTPDLPALLNTMHCSGEVPLQGQGESSKDYLHRLSVPPDVDNMTSLLSQTLDVGGVIGSSAQTTAKVQDSSYVGLPCNLMVTLEGEKAAPTCEDDNVFIQDSYQKLSLNEPKSPCGIYLNKTENGITHDSHTPATDQAVAKVEDYEDKEILLPLPSTRIHETKSGDANICLSTVSLASNSSSGSGSVNGEVAALTANGIHRLMDNGSNDVLPVSGAIPKSISFDKTAEKGDKEGIFPDDPKNKRGFFRNFKLPFRGKGRKSARYQDDVTSSHRSNDKESSEEILAKYRKKSSGPHMSEGSSANKVTENADEKEVSFTVDDEHQLFDPQNPEASYAFQDAKKKLRLVLSTAELQIFPHTVTCRLELAMQSYKKDGELVTFLKIQLAEAINLQDRILAAQLHETLRCVRFFDKAGCRKLFKSLKDDYKKRCPYITYLVRCRQGLLSTLSHLERILKRIERDKAVCDKFMISVCVRLFLEKRERIIQRFMDEFQKLSASDEKTYLVEQLLQFLWKDMETDAAWQGASINQLELAQQVVERSIMSQIYIHALYPNGDGDVLRDQLLHDHMEKLSKVITPSHKDLRISKVYCNECPWPSAQAEIMTINAFKTPRDKLNCVVRCCNTIMNLLSIASEKSVPAADDFIPVLVYVLIKANPNSLLSTVQYVNSFYQKQLKGEDEYWWIQFCSAIEFIKTMDYNE